VELTGVEIKKDLILPADRYQKVVFIAPSFFLIGGISDTLLGWRTSPADWLPPGFCTCTYSDQEITVAFGVRQGETKKAYN
jgi:hypothetical protein